MTWIQRGFNVIVFGGCAFTHCGSSTYNIERWKAKFIFAIAIEEEKKKKKKILLKCSVKSEKHPAQVDITMNESYMVNNKPMLYHKTN